MRDFKARRIEGRILADAEVARLKDEQEVRIKEMRLQGDNAVNLVATSRIIAVRQLAELRKMLLAEVGALAGRP